MLTRWLEGTGRSEGGAAANPRSDAESQPTEGDNPNDENFQLFDEPSGAPQGGEEGGDVSEGAVGGEAARGNDDEVNGNSSQRNSSDTKASTSHSNESKDGGEDCATVKETDDTSKVSSSHSCDKSNMADSTTKQREESSTLQGAEGQRDKQTLTCDAKVPHDETQSNKDLPAQQTKPIKEVTASVQAEPQPSTSGRVTAASEYDPSVVEPVISLQFRSEGTSSSTIRVGFDVLNETERGRVQERTPTSGADNVNIENHAQQTTDNQIVKSGESAPCAGSQSPSKPDISTPRPQGECTKDEDDTEASDKGQKRPYLSSSSCVDVKKSESESELEGSFDSDSPLSQEVQTECKRSESEMDISSESEKESTFTTLNVPFVSGEFATLSLPAEQVNPATGEDILPKGEEVSPGISPSERTVTRCEAPQQDSDSSSDSTSNSDPPQHQALRRATSGSSGMYPVVGSNTLLNLNVVLGF